MNNKLLPILSITVLLILVIISSGADFISSQAAWSNDPLPANTEGTVPGYYGVGNGHFPESPEWWCPPFPATKRSVSNGRSGRVPCLH
jgi:hypothetical protein